VKINLKAIVVMAAIPLIIVSCDQKDKSTAFSEADLKFIADSILTGWHKAAGEADFDTYFGALDEKAIFIGTDASEIWTKQEFEDFSRPYFQRKTAWDFKTLERNIYTGNGNELLWFDEILDTWMGTCRGSGVIENTENGFKIKHYVLSIAIPNDDVKAVIQAKRENDSIFLERYRNENSN
jgi:hypothetical protein